MSAGHAPQGAISAVLRAVAAVVIFASGAPAAARAAEAPPLASVSIEGSSVYAPAELFAAYRERLGQPATRELARAIAGAVTDRYQADGYAKPEMRLDEALVADGVMRITVFEPRITRVTIEGTPGRYREDIERIAAGVQAAVPLTRDAIREAVSEMRRLSGLEVTATTRRDGAAPNAHELVLDARFEAVAGSARVNNRGTDEVGPLFVIAQAEANDPFGGGGTLGAVLASAVDTDEYLSGALYFDRPLGAAGGRGLAMAFRSRSAPHERPADLDDEYARDHFTLRYSHPAGRAMTLALALEADDFEVDRAGAIIRDDRLRILEAGLRASGRALSTTQLAGSLEVRQGLDALGAGLRALDLAVDPRSADFSVAQLQLTSYSRLPAAFSLRFDLFAQYSGDVLPDIERFKIGGERLGRGFEVAEIAGDRGLGGKLLLRRELAAAELPVGTPSVYGFYDLAATWKNDLPGRESAATLGIGLGLQGRKVSGYVEVAKPLTHADVEGKRDAAVFAELGYRF
jgi:hemolysin activation/secretion protein